MVPVFEVPSGSSRYKRGGLLPVPRIALRYDLFCRLMKILAVKKEHPRGSLIPHKRDQIVIDPVCFSGGHLCNNFHTIGLFRSIESYLGHALQGQNDARCH